MSVGTVTVRGSAVVAAEPDDAVLDISLTALEQRPDDALSVVARKSEALKSVLDELGVEMKSRSTTGVTVRSDYRNEGHRSVHAGYRATSSVRVMLVDTSILGRLMREAVDKADALLAGPWWRVAPSNPARVHACEEAAIDAKRKAEAYARALGVRLGAIVSAKDPATAGLEMHPTRGYVAMAAAEYGPEPVIERGELEVSASIDVTFDLQPA